MRRLAKQMYARPARHVLLLILLGGSMAAAVGQTQVTAVAGAGSRSCAQMQADVTELPNVRRAYVSWMQGYLSGRNAARESDGLPLIDLADYEDQWEWLLGWCTERPAGTLADAVNALFGERIGQGRTD